MDVGAAGRKWPPNKSGEEVKTTNGVRPHPKILFKLARAKHLHERRRRERGDHAHKNRSGNSCIGYNPGCTAIGITMSSGFKMFTMENVFGEILFHKEGIPFRSVRKHNDHGICFLGTLGVMYGIGHGSMSLYDTFDFDSAETRNKWSMMVVNIKYIPNQITQHGSDLLRSEGFGASVEYKEKWFHAWLRILKEFIEEFGEEKLPKDIRGAMKETEETLGLPVTFQRAYYMGN